jgi:hypothetical protein
MAERAKARVTEVVGSHAVYVSKPREVAEIIEKAAASSNWLIVAAFRASFD